MWLMTIDQSTAGAKHGIDDTGSIRAGARPFFVNTVYSGPSGQPSLVGPQAR
jgi:hypothetical protein